MGRAKATVSRPPRRAPVGPLTPDGPRASGAKFPAPSVLATTGPDAATTGVSRDEVDEVDLADLRSPAHDQTDQSVETTDGSPSLDTGL